ncbi:LAQU0S06e01926g1_1 [Lachancea quebecensis]|uniref:Mediator of RNA polymerase II transcription subunit 4 n=1 Tax=Lachancea quebecensis TaxID=1654605 RepID=A0A0P1KU28_9SACH|nr:LAQU0S06e01926g1_1 [Lachancea quebecensis]
MSTSMSHRNPGHDRSDSVENPLSKVQVYNDICEFEETLGKLVASVDRFNPDLELTRTLIEVDKRLYKSLECLPKYDEIDTRARALDEEHRHTDEKTVRILETLTECGSDLNALPMLEQVEFERETMLKQREKVFTDVLLDYAMKLAKFTHVPPTFDKGTVGPNNFVWPAEDAMRRGMLAIASLRASEDTNLQEKQASSEQKSSEESSEKSSEKSSENNEAQNDTRSAETKEEPIARRPSFGFDESGAKDHESEKADDDIDLDLDLFNSEEF